MLPNDMAKQRRPKVSEENPQLAVLRGILEEMKRLNGRVGETNTRIEGVRTELEDELDHGRRPVLESEVRFATATTQLSGDVQTLSGLIREWREEHRGDRAKR